MHVRDNVWRKACKTAGIDPPVRLDDLRHSHASWLLAGGADLQVVKGRLRHVSIARTEKYLHTLPDADETALAALDRISSRPGATAQERLPCSARTAASMRYRPLPGSNFSLTPRLICENVGGVLNSRGFGRTRSSR
jgi:hypothetical protein